MSPVELPFGGPAEVAPPAAADSFDAAARRFATRYQLPAGSRVHALVAGSLWAVPGTPPHVELRPHFPTTILQGVTGFEALAPDLFVYGRMNLEDVFRVAAFRSGNGTGPRRTVATRAGGVAPVSSEEWLAGRSPIGLPAGAPIWGPTTVPAPLELSTVYVDREARVRYHTDTHALLRRLFVAGRLRGSTYPGPSAQTLARLFAGTPAPWWVVAGPDPTAALRGLRVRSVATQVELWDPPQAGATGSVLDARLVRLAPEASAVNVFLPGTRTARWEARFEATVDPTVRDQLVIPVAPAGTASNSVEVPAVDFGRLPTAELRERATLPARIEGRQLSSGETAPVVIGVRGFRRSPTAGPRGRTAPPRDLSTRAFGLHGITGRYEEESPAPAEGITVQINHVGHHLEGWWQQRHPSSPWFDQLELSALSLTRDEPNLVEFSVERGAGLHTPTPQGVTQLSLVAEPSSSGPHLTLGGRRFRRVSDEARMSPTALRLLRARTDDPIVPWILAQETAPLDRNDRARVEQQVRRLMTHLAAWESSARRATDRMHALQADTAVLNAMPEPAGPTRQPFQIQEPLVRDELLRLVRDGNGGDIPRDLRSRIEVMVNAVVESDTPAIQAILGIRYVGSASVPPVPYRWSFTVTSHTDVRRYIDGSFRGLLTMERLDGDRWTATYPCWGRFASGQMPAHPPALGPHGLTTTRGPLGRADFVGDARVVPGEPPTIVFWPRGRMESAAAPGAAATFGSALSPGGIAITIDSPESTRWDSPAPAPVQIEARARAAFASGQAELSQEGLRAIGIFCALHLRALRAAHPRPMIAVDGFATPLGSDEDNRILSQNRADNARRAIQDMVGRVEGSPPIGWGEPQPSDPRDRSDPPSQRTVRVRLEGGDSIWLLAADRTP